MGISQKEFLKLQTSVDWSELQMERAREERFKSIQQLVGSNYGEDGADKVTAVNFIKLATDIHVRSLVPRTPAALMTVVDRNLKATAANLELAVNKIPKEINLGSTLRRWVLEALFSMGILRVGLHTVGEVLGYDYGEIFVELITIDDYFYDKSAKSWEEIQYEGHSYWMAVEDLKKLDWLSKEEIENLDTHDNIFMSEHGGNRAENVSVSGTTVPYKKRVWLRDVWLPEEGQVITCAVNSKKLLNTIDWEGPPRGPYHRLGYSDVPGNLDPLPPVSIWRDLHDLDNALFRKLSNQADGEKTVLGFQGGDEESINNFKGASDGDGIEYTGAEPKKLTAGGVSPATLAFFLQCKELTSYFAGSIDVLGGLSPMTETVGQDKLLSEAAGAQIRDMASKTIEAMRKVFYDLAWYEWHDPLRERTLEKSIPGMPGMSIPVRWGPESRQGNFSVYDIDIDVYSIQDDSPGSKLQRLGFIMDKYVGPLMPAIQQQSGQLNAQAVLELVAKLSDFPELADLITFVEPSEMQSAQGQQAGSLSETTRRYEHTSRPGATPQGKSDILQRILVGDRPQEAEAGVLG